MAHIIELKTLKGFDLSIYGQPQVAVFDKHEDYPENAVAKIMDNGSETNVIMLADNPNDLRWDIRKHTNLTWCPRGKDDVPALVGVYL